MAAVERAGTVMTVVGARPNFMKTIPVIAALKRRTTSVRHTLVHTGQHYDDAMSRIFLQELGVGAPDEMLSVGSASHAVQTARVMERIEPVMERIKPGLVLVPGDVNSTLAAALVASKLGIRVGHIEAGLRSFDRSMPEEINRVLTDQISDLLFIHSPEALDNLVSEGVSADRVHAVGNTMIDTLVAMRPRITEMQAAQRRGLSPSSYLVVTLHRPALVDGPLLAAAVGALEEIARDMVVVFPIHPRTAASMDRQGLSFTSPHVRVVDPLGYVEFLSLGAGLGRGAHRLWRYAGGDHLSRSPVLHAARQHRAPDHLRGGHQCAARVGARAHQRGPRTDRAGTIAAGRGTTRLGRRRCRTSRRRSARDRARRRCGAGGRRLVPAEVGAPVVTRPATSDNPRLAAQAGEAANTLLAHAALRDWRGPDPYDGLFFPWPSWMTGGRRRRQAIVQAHARAPVDIRRVYRRTHPQIAKSLGVFGSVAMRLARDGRPAVAGLGLGALTQLDADCTAGPVAWGYPFDVQTRWSFYPAGSPNVVVTSFAVQGLLEGSAVLSQSGPQFRGSGTGRR